MIDNRTPHFNLTLPDQQNLLIEDLPRIRGSIVAIDDAMQGLLESLGGISVDVDAQLAQFTVDMNSAISALQTVTDKKLAEIQTLAYAGL